MKVLKTLFVGMLVVGLIVGTCPVYAAPKEGKGKGAEKSQGNQGQGNQGQGQIKGNRGKAVGHASNAEKRQNAVKRARKQADIRANRPEKPDRLAKLDRGRSAEHRKIKEAKVHPRDLFNALERARWAHNPKDDRGQGNMGKPKMRDPYGFDKDSGREGSERGRPIREALLDLASILNIETISLSGYYEWLLYYADLYRRYGYRSKANYFERVAQSLNTSEYTTLAINYDNITYSLNSTALQDWIGASLEITTSLVSISDYSNTTFKGVWNSVTQRYEYGLHTIEYSAGEVISQETQTVTVTSDTNLSYTYNPPNDIAPTAGYSTPSYSVPANLVITVSDPVSGRSYSYTDNRTLMLFRCPYGKVYNAKTKQPVVGAKICVHFEDGSIVPLDKASNPTAKNPQKTDATGRYGFKLATNRKYYLTAKAPGYKDYKSSVFTEKWHVLREDIALTPVDQKLASNVE